ncbi:MAG: hypothetical protein WCI27_06675 [Candidatus Omnitrophota bacterium]
MQNKSWEQYLKSYELARDSSQASVDASSKTGGIDLNAGLMALDVVKQGKGVDMRVDPVMIAEFKRGDFTGVQGVILRIVPIASLPGLLGLEENASGEGSV